MLSGHKKRSCPSKRIPTTGDPLPGSGNQGPTSTTANPDPTPRSTSENPNPTPRSTADAGLGPSEVQKRQRAKSERIIKQSLRKRVVTKDGSGSSAGKPVTLN